MKITRLSENSFKLDFSESIDQEDIYKVAHYATQIRARFNKVIIDLVFADTTICFIFNMLLISADEMQQQVEEFLAINPAITTKKINKVIEIPVCYADEFAMDMDYLCAEKNMTAEEVIAIHTASEYDVCALGFTMGFAYLGYLDEKIACPRKETPRKLVPKGSVGIAEDRTGIYPIDIPGGWQIIGRTPLEMIGTKLKRLPRLGSGDRVKFKAISMEEYNQLLKQKKSK